MQETQGGRSRRGSLAVAMLIAAAACATRKPMPVPLEGLPPSPSICYECFWEYQDPELREDLVSYYGGRSYADPLVRADVRSLLGRVTGAHADVCGAHDSFRAIRESMLDPHRRLFVDEALAFTAAECGHDASPEFERAARTALSLRETWKAGVYRALARGSWKPQFGEAPIEIRIDVPKDAHGYVLGESAIRVGRGWKVAVQSERTVRDWLSYQMAYDFSGRMPIVTDLLDYHEGARLRDLRRAAEIVSVPLTGTIVVRKDDRWVAPDEKGIFRFEILPDKVQYPTTRVAGDVALLVDTHGISAIVGAAVNLGAKLVVGCGDYPEKMKAAYHLAQRGIDVYFPCDRFVGDIIGYDAPGVLLGSAPIRRTSGGAVIGDRPISFRMDEVVVVEDTTAKGRAQYYDAPARYFRRLQELHPIELEWVQVEGPGESRKVIDKAEEIEAMAIAVRVETEADAEPIREWLAGSKDRKVVLFHSAPYPAGYALFDEFPGQTTFGDPRPRFF